MRKQAKNRGNKLMRTPLFFTKIALLFILCLTALDARWQVSETAATLGNQTFCNHLPGSEYRVQRTDQSGQTHYALFEERINLAKPTMPSLMGSMK